MDYRYEFVDGPFQVIVTTSGDADTDAIVAGRRRLLADPRFRPEMNILVDHSRLDVSAATAEEIRDAAATASGERPGTTTGLLAIVSPSPLQFGLMRMYQAFASEDLESRLAVVRSVEAAYRWLEERTAGPPRPGVA